MRSPSRASSSTSASPTSSNRRLDDHRDSVVVARDGACPGPAERLFVFLRTGEAKRVDVCDAYDIARESRDEPRDDRGELRIASVEGVFDEPPEGGRIDSDRTAVNAQPFAREAVGDDRAQVFGSFGQA